MPEYTDADAAPQADAPSEERMPMTDDEVVASLKKMIEDAESFIDSEVSPLRTEATEYYQGQPFGNEVDGRSQFVMTTQRDTVTAMLPSMMRAIWGPERKVEFLPTGPEDVAQAEQETAYINDVVMLSDNPGFMHTYAWLKDGLVRTTGIVKWRWNDDAKLAAHILRDATEDQVLAIAEEEGVEITKLVAAGTTQGHQMPDGSTMIGPAMPGPDGQLMRPVEVQLFDMDFTRTEPDGRAEWGVVPPEEILWNRDARDFASAQIVVHRMRKTTTELLEMGIPQSVIDEHGGENIKLKTNEENVARNPLAQALTSTNIDGDRDNTSTAGPNDYHSYYETYPMLDVDGDGKSELRKVCLLGPGMHVVENEPAPERPFALYVPDPEPHTVLGLSIHDYVADLQRIESFMFRGAADSLALTLNPRYEVVENKVSIPDVLNHELGAPIRVTEPNMVRPLTVEFVGANVLPMLEYVQSIRENRIGITKAAAGLNPDALQSSTKAAVAATVTAAQQRIELFTRIFAETAFKDLMKGLRRLIIRHQPRARMVRLNGKYVEVDPRTWNADRDVHINVALGLGATEDRLNVLGAIAADIAGWVEKLGPVNALTGLPQLRNVMARILKLQGYPDASEFYKPLDANWQPPPPPPAPPDPAMLVAQAEVQKTGKEIEKMDADFALKEQEQRDSARQSAAALVQKATADKQKDDLERDKLDADIRLKIAEMELKYGVQVDIERIKADLERDRENIRAQGKLREAQVVGKAQGEAAKEAIAAAKTDAAPTIQVNVPEIKVPAPVVHVQAAAPAEKKRGKRRRSTARKNSDGSITIDSEEDE